MNLKSPYWIKPKNTEIIPSSELAMHAGAANMVLIAYCRTGKDYAHIMYGNNKLMHGLISEVLQYQGDAYNGCIKSEIVSQDLLF